MYIRYIVSRMPIEIQFNSLFHFTQSNTILTVYPNIYVNNNFTDDLVVFYLVIYTLFVFFNMHVLLEIGKELAISD